MTESLFRGTSLCVIGNINRDLKTTPFPAMPGLFEDGETSVNAIAETLGGGGANSAAAAATLGARVAMLGNIGDDVLGRRLTAVLRRLGIDTRLRCDPEHATGTTLALTFDHGSRHFVSSLPNNRALSDADLDLSGLGAYAHLLRADIWFSEAMLFGGNARVLQQARQAGMTTSIDLNWDPAWGHADAQTLGDRRQAIRDLLPWVNLAHGNVRELNTFAESGDLMTSLERLTRWGVEAVVVHLGAEGAGFYHRGEWTTEPPAPVGRMDQTTGTGDVLSVCMMLLSQRAELDSRARLRLANAVVGEFIEGRLVLVPPLGEET